jgi:hypothetical protein
MDFDVATDLPVVRRRGAPPSAGRPSPATAAAVAAGAAPAAAVATPTAVAKVGLLAVGEVGEAEQGKGSVKTSEGEKEGELVEEE